MRKIDKKSQSILSYVLLIAVLTFALISMGVFIKRAIQGKYRQSADVYGGGEQYQPQR